MKVPPPVLGYVVVGALVTFAVFASFFKYGPLVMLVLVFTAFLFLHHYYRIR
jgi:hypothetical protein